MAILAGLMLNVSAMAQTDGAKNGCRHHADGKEMIQIRTNRMVEKYGLNNSQAKKLLELNTEYAGKIGPMCGGRGRFGRGMHPGFGGPKMKPADSAARPQRPNKEQMEAARKQMRERMDAYRDKLKKLMTAEQYQKYEADMQQMRNRRGLQGTHGKREIRTEQNH